MAERLITLAQLREQLDAVVAAVEHGETVVVIGDQPGQAPVPRIVLMPAAHGQPAVEQPAPAPAAKEESRPVEATVGGVAGGLVAGAGTTLSSITGNPSVEKGARRLGRRLGRALAVGLDALDAPQKPPPGKP